jgi:hypothetical protein
MIARIRRWFWAREEALDILSMIRREQMLYRHHPRFRQVITRIQGVLDA